MNQAINKAIIQIFREEHGRIMSILVNHIHDFSLAEDAIQDALVIALEKWEDDGVPHNPAAWITTVAKRRALDRIRRSSKHETSYEDIEEKLESELKTEFDDETNDMILPDDRLKLMFTCCHPALSMDAQVALTLKVVGGLSTDEIARAFLVNSATMTRRLTRAKTKIRDAGIPYRIPPAHLLAERFESLLSVIYLIFNEGYCATGGDSLLRLDLCKEAIYLCRILLKVVPQTMEYAEVQGLLALMLLHDSRRLARTTDDGKLILLKDQNRNLWIQTQIQEGVALIEDALQNGKLGAYQVQAAISAVHAEAKAYVDTDWVQIAELYSILAKISPSPIVEMNRAVAIGMAYDVSMGLNHLMTLQADLVSYYPYYAALADFLLQTHQREAACDAYEKAISLCHNPAEKKFLQKQLDRIQF